MSWTFYDANGTLLQGLGPDTVTSAHIVDGTIVTADLGNITGLDSTSTITLDATTDIVLDAGGADILLKDGGTDFGGFTNTSGNLIIKSGTTTAMTFAGANVTAAGVVTGTTVEATADTSAGDNAAIGYTSAEGLILTGQGSTNDITIKNDADAAVISIPTGTTGVTFAGTTTLNGVAYTWPGSDGAGSLRSDGSGALTWTAVSAGVGLGLVIALS